MGVSPHVTTITLGRWSPKRLDATYPPTPGAPSTLAYLVLLRVEIARFTRCGFAHRVAMRTRLPGARLAPRCTHRTPKKLDQSTRLCCSNPHLRAMHLRTQLVSGQSLTATLPYAVRTFLQCLVSQIAPAVVWRASPPDYRASPPAPRAAAYGYAQSVARNSNIGSKMAA